MERVRVGLIGCGGNMRGHIRRLVTFPDVEIVAIVEREERRALGVTVEGVPIELVAAEPDCFGTALTRATGATAYVEALEPLPDVPDEDALYKTLGVPWCPPELREQPFRGDHDQAGRLPVEQHPHGGSRRWYAAGGRRGRG